VAGDADPAPAVRRYRVAKWFACGGVTFDEGAVVSECDPHGPSDPRGVSAVPAARSIVEPQEGTLGRITETGRARDARVHRDGQPGWVGTCNGG
jgi:hypothetical protein